jgi:hypothetical protein
MTKTVHFSIGIVVILIVSTIIFSTNFSMAFPQSSNQNMMMDQWPMMKPINQTEMMGMGSPMMMGQSMMMPCMVIGTMMMGNQPVMVMTPCTMMNPGMMGMGSPMMGMGSPMMGMGSPMMGMGSPMTDQWPMMKQMNQTEMMKMGSPSTEMSNK